MLDIKHQSHSLKRYSCKHYMRVRISTLIILPWSICWMQDKNGKFLHYGCLLTAVFKLFKLKLEMGKSGGDKYIYIYITKRNSLL